MLSCSSVLCVFCWDYSMTALSTCNFEGPLIVSSPLCLISRFWHSRRDAFIPVQKMSPVSVGAFLKHARSLSEMFYDSCDSDSISHINQS